MAEPLIGGEETGVPGKKKNPTKSFRKSQWHDGKIIY